MTHKTMLRTGIAGLALAACLTGLLFFSACFFRPVSFALSIDGKRSRNLRLATGKARSSFMNARSSSSWNGAPASAFMNERLK